MIKKRRYKTKKINHLMKKLKIIEKYKVSLLKKNLKFSKIEVQTQTFKNNKNILHHPTKKQN